MTFSRRGRWVRELNQYINKLLETLDTGEHRALEDPMRRSIPMEAGFALRFLFLNNSYHMVHHELPEMSWYDLPDI